MGNNNAYCIPGLVAIGEPHNDVLELSLSWGHLWIPLFYYEGPSEGGRLTSGHFTIYFFKLYILCLNKMSSSLQSGLMGKFHSSIISINLSNNLKSSGMIPALGFLSSLQEAPRSNRGWARNILFAILHSWRTTSRLELCYHFAFHSPGCQLWVRVVLDGLLDDVGTFKGYNSEKREKANAMKILQSSWTHINSFKTCLLFSKSSN